MNATYDVEGSYDGRLTEFGQGHAGRLNLPYAGSDGAALALAFVLPTVSSLFSGANQSAPRKRAIALRAVARNWLAALPPCATDGE